MNYLILLESLMLRQKRPVIIIQTFRINKISRILQVRILIGTKNVPPHSSN